MANKRSLHLMVVLTLALLAVFSGGVKSAEPFVDGQGAPAPSKRSRAVFSARLDELRKLTSDRRADPVTLGRLRREVDQLGAARYSFLSGLYWHTDLSSAQAEATKSGKPILVLRLMGDLRDEYSCANSRFFRSVLYSDPTIAKVLDRDYILYWKKVRDVPKITIEFEDGRKICGTIAGTSIHYVVSSDGLLLNAFPGLYEPQTFLNHLTQTQEFAASLSTVDPQQRQAVVRYQVRRRLTSLTTEWGRKLVDVSEQVAAARGEDVEQVRGHATAAAASRLSVTKSVMTEKDILKGLAQSIDALDDLTDTAAIKAIAETMDSKVSDVTRQIIDVESHGSNTDARVAKLSKTLAMDTVLNEYRLRPRLLRWMLEEESSDLNELNRKVYAELFLTPDSDPWFGLLPVDRYTALINDGVRE